MNTQTHPHLCQLSSNMSFPSKDDLIKLNKQFRVAAFVSVVISTAALLGSVLLVPVFYHYAVQVNNMAESDLDFCKMKTKNLWSRVVKIAKTGGHNPTYGNEHRSVRKAVWSFMTSKFGTHPAETQTNIDDKHLTKLKDNASSFVGDKELNSIVEGLRGDSPPYPPNRQPFPPTSGGYAPGNGGGQCCTCQQGPAGPAGPPGYSGNDGTNGTPGSPGSPGEDAPAGYKPPPCTRPCPSGPPGPPGQAGPKGVQGNQGDEGPRGPTGPIGERGPAGNAGEQGLIGSPGDKGPMGPMGKLIKQIPPQGPPGAVGAVGQAGTNGLAGPNGKPGVQGPQGEKGDQGDMGFPGRPGPPGAMGTPGVPGATGSCGHCPPPRLPPGY